MTSSLWGRPGIRPLLVMTFLGFTGYALLLPVAPLWAARGGADSAGAGLVNGVLLIMTVLTQLFVPMALRRWGWGPVMGGGMVLLGAPAAAYGLSDALAPVLVLSAVRGIGFGILTVVGSAAIAALVDPSRRGEAIGAYGLAVALPNVGMLPLGPWVAEQVSWWLVFGLSALPMLGVPAALQVASVLHVQAPDLLHPTGRSGRAYVALLRPMLLLLAVTLTGGAVITFAPQMVEPDGLVLVGLFVMGFVAALSRWRAGVLADRFGVQRFLAPLIALTAVGAALVAWAVHDAGTGADTGVVAFLCAMVVVGLAYGALQNLTLVLSFQVVERTHHNLASAVWNIGFDLGTALGSVAVGAIAAGASFSTGFVAVTVVAAGMLPLALLGGRARAT